MKKTFTTIIALCVFAISFAQTPTHRECGTLSHHEYLKQSRPNYENELTAYNQMIDQYLANQALLSPAQRNSAAIVTIPVVVHVVYNTAAENISDAQAASQVQVLNDDFAKLNTDANKVTQPTFSTVASGANIRFCLAQRDPNGNPTTGIVHKSTTATSFGTNDAVKSNAQGGDNPWDVTKYVNVWICDLSGSLLGYGEFPTTSLSNTWGLVIDYAYAGKGGSATPPFNLGRTGTHEFGHCFNLYHIWGDDNGSCSGSDQCSDTPNQASEHYGAFAQGSIQTDACSPSSPGTMWMNYMDYTDDGSMYMFTQQQVARMEAVVNTAPWNVLQNSNACSPPTALDANLSSIIKPLNGSATCNNAITPQVTVVNSGSVTLTSVRILYKMDATATQTLNWSGSLASGASTVVTLNAYTGLTTAAHTFSVWTTLPNNGTDQNTTNDSKSSTFTVTSGGATTGLPFTEGFESGATPPAGWTIVKANTIDAAVSWSVIANSTGITAGSTRAARMDNYSSNSDIHGQIDALKSPAISFTAATTPSVSLSFDVSHRRYATSGYDDTLNVYISTDCGGSWTKLYSKGGSQLATAVGTQTTAFTPTVGTQWRRETISLASYSTVASATFKFESVSGYGNNVYLDNINITYTAAASPAASFSIASTPACTGSTVQLTDMSTNTPTTWTWTATSPTGVVFSNANIKNPTVSFANPGTYTIGLSAANGNGTGTTTRTITVNATPTVAVSNATICSGANANLTASGATTYLWNTGATTASISVAPTTTAVYTVTGTSNSCANTRTVSVTVKATPTVAVNSSTICSGNSANLTATGATTYSWNTGASTSSISVSPTTTANYTVTGTTNGCSNVKTVTVTVKATPTVAVSNATICSGTAANLTATGATTYSWSTGASTSSVSVSPASNANYTVVGTTNGCSNTKTVSVTVKTTPTVTANSATICAGGTANLVAGGATTYQWNTGSTSQTLTVNPTGTTNYTVTGATNGCPNSKTVTVTVNNLPNVTVPSATICSGATATLTASGAATYSWSTGSTSASIMDNPSSNTTYTVTGTSSAGCVKTVTASITVGSAPSIVVNSQAICSGSSATLSASGVSTYTWNTGSNASNIVVNPTSTTVYTVSGDLTGCGTTAVSTATVEVNSNPTVTMGSLAGPYCINNPTVALTGSPSGGVFSGAGVSGSVFDPASSGAGTFTLTYVYTDANSCSGSDNESVVVSLCTGIEELSSSSVSIYPNPAKDILNISIDHFSTENTHIEMFDAIGKLIVSDKVNNSLTSIDMSHLSRGMYTIRIVIDGKQLVRRIVKE